jgi:hypothetical protein
MGETRLYLPKKSLLSLNPKTCTSRMLAGSWCAFLGCLRGRSDIFDSRQHAPNGIAWGRATARAVSVLRVSNRRAVCADGFDGPIRHINAALPLVVHPTSFGFSLTSATSSGLNGLLEHTPRMASSPSAVASARDMILLPYKATHALGASAIRRSASCVLDVAAFGAAGGAGGGGGRTALGGRGRWRGSFICPPLPHG